MTCLVRCVRPGRHGLALKVNSRHVPYIAGGPDRVGVAAASEMNSPFTEFNGRFEQIVQSAFE